MTSLPVRVLRPSAATTPAADTDDHPDTDAADVPEVDAGYQILDGKPPVCLDDLFTVER